MTALASGVSVRGRRMRFLTSGVINTSVDFGTFAALLRWSDVAPFGANLAAFATAVCVSFLLNRFWTFGDRRSGSPWTFVLWMTSIALLASVLLDRAVGMGAPVASAKLGVTLLAMLISYQAMHRLVFVHNRARIALISGLCAVVGMVGLTAVFISDAP